MSAAAALLLFQLAAPTRNVAPVLAFPEAGLDDTAAYQGYQTRFFRDAAGNTVQIYLDGRTGRVVHLLANADDESIGFTVRDANGRPARVRWDQTGADITTSGRRRFVTYRLVADAPRIDVGWFLLGSMRVERDLQYSGKHKAAFADAPFRLPEIDRLLASLNSLDPAERSRQLAFLNAPNLSGLRSRLRPSIATLGGATSWLARIIQPSLDGRDTLMLELRADRRLVAASLAGDSISLRSRRGTQLPFTVTIATTAKPLTRLARTEIFNADFLTFLASVDSTSLRHRWLEREVRGVELLSSREKLMAGLPAYATYFGRDMLVSALMMRPIWRNEMSEFAIASVLRKLSPRGEVSHEEALGGQAVREAAAEYARLVDNYLRARRARDRVGATRYLEQARAVLREHRRVRENYHMIDDEFQLPVLVARWLGDPAVTADRKRAFLLDSTDGGGPRVRRLLKELALVAQMTGDYARNPAANTLVSFPARDSTHWAAASWRDSNVGYAGGRFAMDINAIWAPHALESIAVILDVLRQLGLPAESFVATVPEIDASPLGQYARSREVLRSAITTWWGASRHFVVRLSPDEVSSRVSARLAALPAAERAHWMSVLASTKVGQDSLEFLALSLDARGVPIAVENTDPATRLFLGEAGEADLGTPRSGIRDPSAVAAVLRDVHVFVRDYPVGLFIARVGPVVANDAYATPEVWRDFERDRYHGPRVVWGREVNLFLLGVANTIAANRDAPYAAELRRAIDRVRSAVESSGFRSELWSYELRDGQMVPVRYGTGSDVQLWSTTDLAVQFALSRLR